MRLTNTASRKEDQRDDLEFREWAKNRDMLKYVPYLHGQVRELLTEFGQIDLLWLDFSYSQSDWGWSKGKGKDDWQAEKLVAMIRELMSILPSLIRRLSRGDLQESGRPNHVKPKE